MKYLLEVAVLGLYAPIIIFSGLSCWLFMSRLILPAFRRGKLDVEHYAIGVSATFALAAHFAENVWYGTARWFGQFAMLNDQLIFVGAWKVLILISTVFAVAALQVGTSNKATLGRVFRLALICWLCGALAATAVA